MTVAPEDCEIIFVREPRENKFLKVNSKLTHELRAARIELSKGKVDFFACKTENMPGIDPTVISHDLNVDHTKKLVQQWKKRFTQDKSDIIKKKVNSLKSAGFIRCPPGQVIRSRKCFKGAKTIYYSSMSGRNTRAGRYDMIYTSR